MRPEIRNAAGFTTLTCALACICLPITGNAQDDFFGAETSAPCELRLSGQTGVDWEGPYGRGYDVFDETVAFEPLEISVEHEGAACRYFVTVTPVTPGGRPVLTNGGSQLGYDVMRSTNGPSIISASFEGTASTRIDGIFAGGDGIDPIMLNIFVPPNQFVDSGLYDGQFFLRLYRDDGATWELQDERPVTVTSLVAARLQIESPDFSSGAYSTAVDLGELSAGAKREIAFDIRSNSRVNIAIQSANRGTLAHHLADVSIPYRLRGSGELVDLRGTGYQMHIGTSQSGNRFPLEVEVDPGSYVSGSYADVLTVTFTAE